MFQFNAVKFFSSNPRVTPKNETEKDFRSIEISKNSQEDENSNIKVTSIGGVSNRNGKTSRLEDSMPQNGDGSGEWSFEFYAPDFDSRRISKTKMDGTDRSSEPMLMRTTQENGNYKASLMS